MKYSFHLNPSGNKKLFIIAAIFISGICWYLSNGLTGDFCFLLWIAPVPVLILSFKSAWKQAFTIAFISYLIGRLSWFPYLVSVAFLVPAIIITLILPFIFALIVLITRQVVLRTKPGISLFAFPVFFTAYEFLLMLFSYDGTAGSIAYSQSNFIPLIQIASVTGISGITFFVTLLPSYLSIIWYYRKEEVDLKSVTRLAFFICLSVLLYGTARIITRSERDTIKAGLVVMEEKLHNMSGEPDIEKEKQIAGKYAEKISSLAELGAELIVLPERAVDVRKETGNDIVSILGNSARQNNVFIITGYSNFREEQAYNSAMAMNDSGTIISDYRKVHLVRGLENHFTPGSMIGLINAGSVEFGIAVCKDLDFPEYIRKYGKANTGILFIPAWDFVKDDWLHSRMAVMRGVENGFSEIRTARAGRLTISDCFGRVTAEASSSSGGATVLFGEVSLQRKNTLYTRFGEWFGTACLIAAVIMILFVTYKIYRE